MVVGNPALSRRAQKKSNKNALMIGIPVAAVLLAGLGAAVMMSDKGSSVGDTTTTQASQTTTTTTTAATAPAPAPATPTAPVPVHAAANTMDATPPVTQSAQPTPVRHFASRHIAGRSARVVTPSANDNSTDVSATVPVNPPAVTAPSASTVISPPVINAPPPAVTPQPQADQPVNPAPEATTTQP